MKVSYDKQADAVYIYLNDKRMHSTKTVQSESKDLCFIDMDGDIPVGVEILDASKVFGGGNIELLETKDLKKIAV